MMQNVLDVLMYLFEAYSDQDTDSEPDQDILRDELLRAGFGEPEVDHALGWLEELTSEHPAQLEQEPGQGSVRVFSREETENLDAECRGYLIYLQQIGILSPAQREIVLDRLMALGPGDIEVEQVKWIVLMVLYSQPGQENAFARMEDLVFEESPGALN